MIFFGAPDHPEKIVSGVQGIGSAVAFSGVRPHGGQDFGLGLA
jgi:hypothetical protein